MQGDMKERRSDVSEPLTVLSDNEQLFRQEVEKLAQQRLAPAVAEMDEQEQFRSDLLRSFFELGLMGIEIPTQFGGAGGTFFMALLAIETLSRTDAAAGVIVDVQNTLVNNIFQRWGTPEQQQTFYPRLATEAIGCYCLTEAASGSDAFALQCRATADGSDYVLNGKKIFITNAGEASLFIVFANVDFSRGYRGITAFVVEKGTAGLALGKKETKLGIRASSTCEVIFDGVRVPRHNVIGEVGKGYKIAIETLNDGRIGIAAQMLGLAQGAWQGAMAYAAERSQFGQTLDKFQAVQFKLAELATDIEATRLLVYNVARRRERGLPFTKEAAMAKYFSSQVAEKVASQALEVYGGYGFIKEFPAEKFYRDAKIGQLYEGTTNMQLSTIFKQLSSS